MVALFIATACQGQPKVTIVTKEGRERSFQVEIADTPAKREMGLQYRRDLATDRGMIFLFPNESQQAFWMKNMAAGCGIPHENREGSWNRSRNRCVGPVPFPPKGIKDIIRENSNDPQDEETRAEIS